MVQRAEGIPSRSLHQDPLPGPSRLDAGGWKHRMGNRNLALSGRAREGQDCLSCRWDSSVLATNRGRLGTPLVALSWMKDQPL